MSNAKKLQKALPTGLVPPVMPITIGKNWQIEVDCVDKNLYHCQNTYTAVGITDLFFADIIDNNGVFTCNGPPELSDGQAPDTWEGKIELSAEQLMLIEASLFVVINAQKNFKPY